jgi:hypothetical protein
LQALPEFIGSFQLGFDGFRMLLPPIRHTGAPHSIAVEAVSGRLFRPASSERLNSQAAAARQGDFGFAAVGANWWPNLALRARQLCDTQLGG